MTGIVTMAGHRTKRAARVALAFTLPLASGCGTIVSCKDSWPNPDFFGGTKYDAFEIAHGGHTGIERPMAILDLPLSLPADVIVLPANAAFYWFHWRPTRIRWVDEPGRETGYYVGNGLKAYESIHPAEAPNERRETRWNYRGKVTSQAWIIHAKGTVVPVDSRFKYSPPWWWDVVDQEPKLTGELDRR